MDTTASRPHPVVLAEYDCWGLLAQEDIARVAWASTEGVAIVPVNYVVADGALWFRTQPDTALARQCAAGRVAVEVDHVDRQDGSAWSVVVTGTAERVPGPQTPGRVVDLDIWPSGRRNLFIRVTPADVTGRRIWRRAGAPPPEGYRPPDVPLGERTNPVPNPHRSGSFVPSVQGPSARSPSPGSQHPR